MTDHLILRNYSESDKDSILELLRLNTPTYFALEEKEDLIDYLENFLESYFVIENNRVVVGCGGVNLKNEADNTVGVISWDIIHPDYQGLGLGKRLLDFRIKFLIDKYEIKIIIVRTSQHVFRFYEKMGFKLKEIIKDYWSKDFDLYLMEFEVIANLG